MKWKVSQKKIKSIVFLIAILLLIITAVFQRINDKQDMLSFLQQAEPATAQYKELKGAYETFELIDANGEFLNYAVIASSSGYGGPITMLTTVSREGTIVKAVILENVETPIYLKKVVGMGYPENLNGKSISSRLSENDGVDAVSGATRTTDGIVSAVEKGMVHVGESLLGVTVPALETFHFEWKDGLVIALLILSTVAMTRKIKKLRPWLLVASVIIIGFMAQSSLTLGNFMSIAANKMPAFAERPIWFFLVIGILLIVFISGKNVYCAWVCPFGAVQEGIYKALNLTSTRPDPRFLTFSKNSRWFFIWLAAMLALLFNNPGLASYEPFSVFFGGDGVTAQWLIMGIVLLMSIVIFRFWCRYFCPVGAVLDFVAQIKRQIKRFFGKKKVETHVSASLDEAACSISACSACKTDYSKVKAQPLSTFNKIVACVIVAVYAVIIGALLQNSGLL